MTQPLGSFNFTAQMLAAEAAAVGNGLVFDSSLGNWRVSSAANRTSANSRTQAIAVTAYGGSSVGKVQYQSAGVLPASISLLASGSASWARMSTAGFIERFTPAGGGSSDVVGWAFADGRVALMLGVLTESIVTASGGGGAAAHVAGGPGDVQVRALTGGDLAAAAVAAAGTVLTSNGVGALPTFQAAASGFTPPTGTGFVTVTGGALDPASLAFPLGFAKGGTGLSALGTGLQYLRVNAGATALEFATLSGGVTTTGTGFWHNTSGSLDGAARAVNIASADVTGILPIANGGTNLSAVPGNASEVIINSGGTAYSAATGVKAGSAFLSIGTTPATAGDTRHANNTTGAMFRDSSNASDMTVWATDNVNQVWIASDVAGTHAASFLRVLPVTQALYGLGVSQYVVHAGGLVQYGVPRVGISTPYASEGNAAIALAATHTLSSAEYSRAIWTFSGALGATTATMTVPAPGSADASYIKFIRMANTNTELDFTTGTGNLAQLLAAGATSETHAVLMVTTAGCYVFGVAAVNGATGTARG